VLRPVPSRSLGPNVSATNEYVEPCRVHDMTSKDERGPR
jgi:hypothetical protein